MSTPVSESHDAVVQRLLKKRPGLSAAYLKVAAEGATDAVGHAVLLRAMRDVARAKGMGKVAEKMGVKTASLSRALGPKGNPTLDMLTRFTETVGMQIVLVKKPAKAAAKKTIRFEAALDHGPGEYVAAKIKKQTPRPELV